MKKLIFSVMKSIGHTGFLAFKRWSGCLTTLFSYCAGMKIISETGINRGDYRIEVKFFSRARSIEEPYLGPSFRNCIDFYDVAFSAIFNRVTRMG